MADRVIAALTTDALSVARGGATVVRRVTLDIPAGCWFGLAGANGSGKTSLLRAIAGRLPIAGGSCRIDGIDRTADRAARAAAIGFAPPLEALPAALRGRELLELVGGPLDAVRPRLGDIGTALGIDTLLGRLVGDCSAGMRQRLSIALAFAGGQRHVILDEPFNWLDPVAAYDLRTALRRSTEEGRTIVTALHDLTTFVSGCHAGVLMTDGRTALSLGEAALAEAATAPQRFERAMIERLRSQTD